MNSNWVVGLVVVVALMVNAVAEADVYTRADVYTQADAYRCFTQKAVGECESELSGCMQNAACGQQMQKYGGCQFEDSQQNGGNIYNGYCFKRWQDRAQLSLPLLTCFASKCNLFYNSEIGVKQIYQCAQWVLLNQQNQVLCQVECQNEIENKISHNFNKKPFGELYSQHFDNEQARIIANLIYNECVSEAGSGKKVIYEQQRIKGEEQLEKDKRAAERQAARDQVAGKQLIDEVQL